ncbi:hypothetical protein A3D85_00325 [Candidatus Amesbacteria bacterium RIFCSPHIGHO2_02_FULL_47_9]|uniref:Uncharacterized protein n=1 Tax=Candidatus Amesbacteria bacterium RIFCSPHIGHO2_01_FULL_48_32b TaxID=1797253 RepID=A0A1F4YGW0_9BACT|nr:MAG: hypothetical protein A2876_01030 [Candidatus Amesbacteria bacterium RIFCSPHIGHO2_01_FULL_48_32b]OGD03524.1 MAG: hypothetical protein A3D85_00325 [Candidatus Amesbacteria bacterium RIFCSPHIGHO2_02_FULL_47_9]OGD07400.1 MAG: hypothetical protein A2899_03800 [Candidatus Amesbacteria bacterium RIFCSPLOWO2_01_FULL_49_25]
MFTNPVPPELTSRPYSPDFLAYRKWYGDPPPEIHTFPGLGKLWGPQQDIIEIARGSQDFTYSLPALLSKFKEEGIYTQNATPDELANLGAEAFCRPLRSMKKTGEFILKVATPKQYTQMFGLDPVTAYHTALRDLGHESGHAYDLKVIPTFVKSPPIGLWDTEVRQWRFNLAYSQAIRKSDWASRAQAFLDDIRRFGSKII